MHPAERLRGRKSMKLQGKTIVLGTTGSIAAVETVKLAHELIRHGAEVHAVLTRSATEIVHPNALQFATGNPVVTAITGSMEYLTMCGRDGKANLLLIAPCTANTMGKIAQGIDDTTVTTYAANALGSGIPILLAPAAHESMTESLATMAEKADADICLVPAAVSDFTPAKKPKGKIPSRKGGLTLELEPTPKLLAHFRKGTRKALVGFKAEAAVGESELKTKAMVLAKEADLDFVVANDVSQVKGDATAITIFDRKGHSESFEGSKALAAERIWRAILHGVRG